MQTKQIDISNTGPWAMFKSAWVMDALIKMFRTPCVTHQGLPCGGCAGGEARMNLNGEGGHAMTPHKGTHD